MSQRTNLAEACDQIENQFLVSVQLKVIPQYCIAHLYWAQFHTA